MLKIEQIERLTERVKQSVINGEDNTAAPLGMAETEDLLVVLDWVATKLEQQRVNNKAHLRRQAIVNRLIKEHLSADELASINEAARRAAEKDGGGVGR